MSHIVIVGCGIIGATLAYELSLIEGLKITVVDKQPPAQASTGAALGVLMGIISHKVKGKPWRMRQTSVQRYGTLIPELEAITNRRIPFNRQGILMLLPSPQVTTEDLAFWERIKQTRHNQGWDLEILDVASLEKLCPQVDVKSKEYIGAIYSPQDRQLDPTALTLALVEAAKHNGVDFKFGVSALGVKSLSHRENSSASELETSNQENSSASELETSNQENSSASELETSNQENSSASKLETSNQENSSASELETSNQENSSASKLETSNQENSSASKLETTNGAIAGDWFIISAGLGSTSLTQQLNKKVDIRPVLGQAIHLHLGHPLGNSEFQPAITCNDVYVLPTDAGIFPTTDYWVGATVEFPQDSGEVSADKELLDEILKNAIATFPELSSARVIRTWSGLRPRPEGRSAPVIEKLPGFDNVILASAHYRNGILLAPATAEMVKGMIFQ